MSITQQLMNAFSHIENKEYKKADTIAKRLEDVWERMTPFQKSLHDKLYDRISDAELRDEY